MRKLSYVLVCASMSLWACGGGDNSQPAANTPTGAKPAAAPAAVAAAAAKGGMQKISDVSDAWDVLYKQNEKVINGYEGMPIMDLVTPQMTFLMGIQYDMLNMENKDGRFDGTLMLAGYKGFVEKHGSKITFKSEQTLEKDGFGPLAKKGDHKVNSGSLDLDKKYYIAEDFTERAGAKISHAYYEFKMLGDGSMVCLDFSGSSINGKGDSVTSNSVVYLHNGKNQYDFVIGGAKTGPDFKTFSFADKGDLTKQQAIDLFKASGYTIEKSGGIKDGKLVVDK